MRNRQRTRPISISGAMLAALLAVSSGGTTAGAAKPEGPGPSPDLPIMGWSSWTSLRCDPGPTEANIRAQALLLHEKLQAYGYQYVNVDSCWQQGNTVDAFGRPVPDPVRFPNGIGALSDFVHGLGLKFGLYGFPGVPVAAYDQNSAIEGTPFHVQDIVASGRPFATTFRISYKIDFSKPGAQEYLDSFARQLAAWGADFLKYDSVHPGSSSGSFDTRPDVAAMSRALQATGRPIKLMLSWHIDAAHGDFFGHFADAWRADDDIECYNTCPALSAWANPTGYVRDTVLARFFDAAEWTAFNGRLGWTDLDSLVIGNGPASGLSDDERRTTMTLWSIVGSPLYVGNDLSTLDETGLSLLTNDEVIAVDQAGTGGRPVDNRTDEQVWYKLLPDGSYAVALFNLGAAAAPVTARWSDVGFCGIGQGTDLWNSSNPQVWRDRLTVTLAPHASALYRVRPLSVHPCPEPPGPPAEASYEAESVQNILSAGAIVASCAGCSGARKVGNLYGGGAVQFSGVRVDADGDYALTLFYATGDERTGYVSANGGPEALVGFFPRTGDFNTVGHYTVRVRLNSGDNTIRYSTRPGTYSPDLDRITVASTR